MLYTVYVRTIENKIVQLVVYGQEALFLLAMIFEKSPNVFNYKVQDGDTKFTPGSFGFENMEKWVTINFWTGYDPTKWVRRGPHTEEYVDDDEKERK